MASLVFMLRCLCLSYLTNLVCSVDCSAQPPVQRASKGRPVKLTGLSISHEISEEELDLSIQASSGSVRLLLLDGLQLLEGGGSHSVAVRATLPLLQAALEQVQYTSCTDCSAVLDSIQLTCASPNNMQSEAIVQMEIDSVLPYLRAASLYREIKNYTAHVFRDVSLEYAMYSGILQLNITSSSGTVAVEHDWDAPGAILKGTAAEVAWILKSSGVTFKPNRSQTFDHLVNLQLCLTDETGAPVSECITLSLKVLGLEVAAVVDEELKVGGEPDTAVASAVASVASVESHILHVWMPAADEMPHLEPCESTGVDEVWFRIQEDVWEAPICIDLRGDADESATYVDLQVSVSTGMVHCDAFAGRRAGIFTTRCAGTSSDPSFPSLASCEVGAEVALRPTRGEVRECLRHLVFTPPSNFDGEVLMRITVAFVDVFGAEPRKIIQESKIQVEAVNDMPWLYWVTLPPQEMLNNESFPFRGIRVYDPDVVGWRAERAESFTLTFQTLVGEILFPLGEPLWQEQVPAPPYPSRYLRLQGTLQQIQESFNRVLYKPPGWFAGEDEVFVRVSDGGLEGGRNLTGELAFRVTVLQARLPVGLIVKTAALKSKEDEAFWFGQAGGIHIDFPAPEPKLYLKISSTDGALLLDEMVHLSFGSVLSSSTTRLEVIGSMAVLDTLLQEVRWKHPNRDWVSPPAQPAKIELQACQWDLDLKVTMADTCSTRALTVEVEPVDDTPVLFSLNHPWALPLHVQQDTPKSLCCFKIHDIDLRSTGAVGAPWPFAMRIMAKYGNISMAVSEQVILTEAERNLIGLQGSAADLEDVLNTLSYTPPAQMTHRHGLDHLCLFLRDISSSLRVGNIRRYTGCWDIDIEPAAAPVPPPPAQPQPRSSQREVPCDFNIQNDSENETCERLTDLPRRPPPVMFNREEREENISCNDSISGNCSGDVDDAPEIEPAVLVEELPEIEQLPEFNPMIPGFYNQTTAIQDSANSSWSNLSSSNFTTEDPRDVVYSTLTVEAEALEAPNETVEAENVTANSLQIYALSSSVSIAQGSDLLLSNLLRVEDQSPLLWGSGVLGTPNYFDLQLELADGLSFVKPLPVQCTNERVMNWTNPWEVARAQGTIGGLFQQTRLNLHASVELLQQCLQSLSVHVPWNTPVTADAPSTGPSIMSTVPANGSEDVTTSNFQVLLTFNDWVQAGEGNFQIIDCGADNICGQGGTFDDTSVDINVQDTFSVTFTKNLVLITYPHRLSGLHLHQFYVPEGVIRDVSGTNFSGIAVENFTIRTGLTGASPLGWRVLSSNISGAGADGWHVCEAQFYLSTDCSTDLIAGTPAGSSEVNESTFQQNSNYEASLAFDGLTSTCWWSSSTDPGSWIGLHVKTAALYARSVRLVGLSGKVNPDTIYVQFYKEGLWYTLQSFTYTEACVELTSDFSTIFGNEFDTVAPTILSSIPDLSTSLTVSDTQRLALYFSEPIVIMSGSEVKLVDAGADGLCSTSDDVILSIPADLPTAYVRNGTDPWVYVTGNMILVRYPYQNMEAGNYHCLQVDPAVIQDLAGTPFPGLLENDFRFLVAATPFLDETAPVFVATDPPTGSTMEGLQLITFKIFMSEAIAPCDETLMVQTAQTPGAHELYLVSLLANGTEDPSGDRLTISFTPDPSVLTPHTFSISDSVITVSLNRSLLIGHSYSLQIPENSLVDLSTTTVFDITGAPVQIPRNFAGLPLGEVIFHVVEPVLERNPYKKSTIPIWAEAEVEMQRPDEEPLIPFVVDRCYIEPNCSNDSNGTVDCGNGTNATILGVCGMMPQSGDGYLAVREKALWLEPYHWLGVTTGNGTSFRVQLDVSSVNSPPLIKARSLALKVDAGLMTLLAADDGGAPLTLEDDDVGELYVEVILEPQGALSILPSAWRDWTGRVNVTFDFPRVQPDYGSLGQGDWSPTTVEGKPAGKLSFHGGLLSVQAALANLTYTAPGDFEGYGLMKVVVRDGVYMREELILLVVRLPSSGLQVLTSGYGTSALAFEEHDLDTMGCDWSVQDGDGALTGQATYHLSIYVKDPLACSFIDFEDCTSRASGSGQCMDSAELSASKVESSVSTKRGYRVLHLYSPSLEVLQHHLNKSMVFHACNCSAMERFECKQTMFLAVDRMSREDLSVQDMAENTCEVTVVSPLSIFVALRGPPLKLDEDGTLELAERLYFEGNAPGPFWVTLSAEYGSVTAEGDGVYSNGTKNYLHFKVDTVEWLMALMESKEVKLLPAQHFWGTDYLYIGLQSSLDPPNASNVGGRELTLGLNYSMQIEVVPKRDEPQIYMAHGSTAVAQADKAHQVNASIVYVDLAATGHARVHVKSPFGELSFPELDVMMDEEAPGLTEFFADQEFDQEVEEEYATRIPARNGVWPTVSRYETSTGDGFTLSGEVSALNRVLAQLRFTPPADSPNSGALTVSLQRTPSSVDWESESSAGTFQTEEVLAQKDFAVAIEPLAKSKFTCFIGGPAVTFVNPGEESRDGGVTVYPEASASVEVTKAVAEELHEFRVSVKHGTLGLDVNKFPAARICPPFYPDVGGCAQDEVDAWVIYGRIADAALALESLVYTPPIGYAGQDLMRITGSCSEVSLEVKMNIIKGFLPPVVRCCEHEVMEVHRALEPAPVPPAILESNAYGEIPAVAQVRFTTDLGQLAFWPVQGLYFDHGFDVAPIHNVSSQIVADGPGAIVQHGLGSKLALLHIPETEPRVEGTLVVEVLDARSGLSSSCTCPIKVSAYRREGLPLISIDMPTPNTTFLLSGLGVRSWELTVPSFGLISAAFRTPCYVKLSVPRGRLVPPVPPPWRQAAEWREDKQGSYSLLAESVEDASDVVGKLRFLIQEEELDSREPLILAMSIEVFALPSGQQKDLDQAILRDQRDMQLEIRTEPSIPQLWMMTKRMEIQHAERISLERLNLQLLYPRPLVLQLSCEACTFFDKEFSSNSTYQITGMASVLQNHVAQLQMQVTCAVCDFEELLVKAWDPETLQLPSSQTDQGNLIVQVTCPVMIETSPIAKGPPLLRVQSSGVVVQAGESVDLKQLGLQSADPNEPLGLHAVVDHVEVRLSSRQGTLEIDVAALVGATEPYLADAADGAFTANTWSQDQVQVAVTGAEMSGEPFNIPSTNRRVPYVEPSRPANPENRTLLDARGALRPPRVLWTGKSLRLRGPAVQMQMTLSSVKYTADESGGGWDTVTMSMGMQTAELPLYIIRQVGEIVLKASPLKTMVAGHFLKPEIQVEFGPLVRREDLFSVWVTCSHCSFALWIFGGQMETIDSSMEFSGSTAEVQDFLTDLTYVPTDGFIGTDRLQAFVQSQRLQAASEQTQSAQLNMTIQVQLQEIVVPPATIQMPGRLNVFEDSVTDPSIEIHDLKTLAPSGVPLASALTENDGSSRTCLRALEPYTWINESLSTQPCDLWLLINSNGTSMEQLSCEDEGCTLRPAHMADQCLTFITGPVAETAGRPSGGWSLAPCQNTSASSYQSQAFDYTSLAGSNGRFCVQTLNGLEGCFDTLVMEVISQLYYGRPTYTPLVVGVPPLNCSGFVDMMALPEENLTLNENVTDFQLARDRCMGSLSCEYIFDPVGIIDPAPDCIKELVVNYTCPNHEMFQSSTLVYPGQAASMRIQCPVTFLPSVEPLAVHGSLGSGSFLLHSTIDMRRLPQLTSCPSSWRPEINATLPMESFETLVDGGRSSEFCIIGAPVALSEFAQHLRYLPASHWSGSEPVRLMLTAADDPSVVHGTAESWAVVERKNDHPNITAHQLEFQVRIGESLLLSGINISDADMGDGTKWMTLLVATSIGRLYLDPSFLLAPLGTLEPLQGRLDGDFALRVRGSGHDLQAFVDNLRFASEAPAKPSLATRPLNASETEAIISYVLSDTITPQAGALRRHQVAGKVVDPETDEPVQGVEVVLIAQDTWHDYLGYNLATGCSRELLGWTVADCKSYAEQQGHPGFTYGLSSTGGAQACCFKSEDVDLILMNLVADLNVNVYIFQPGGYFVRTTTSALGMYTALMPTGPADIYFTKALRNTRNLSIVVNDNIQVGGAADIYLPALNVVTIWRFEVDWISTAPVDLDAHAFDAWNCHVYFANRLCQHDGSHGLTVTLTRSSRDLLIGKEIITVHQWPCDSTQATIGGYRDIWSCLAYFWVQIFSLHTFADVQGKVSIFRQSILVQEVQLPADNAANDFWVGFVLDWDTSAVYLSANETGTSQLAETFLGGRYELPPVRQVRRLEESESVRILSGTCGDGYRESSEACDDGNLDAGDGCSELCEVEPGYYCFDAAAMDPGNSTNVTNMTNMTTTAIPSAGSGHFSYCFPTTCGDGILGYHEQCDDGNVNSTDGCSSSCRVEPGYYCTQPLGIAEPSTCASRCGDGRRVVMHEECDDANTRSGDGCSSSCMIETGYVCEGGTEMVQDYCHPKCGDGVRVPSEGCDDGNTKDGDGCSSSCIVETGYVCYGGNSSHADSCKMTVCGDGVVEGAEECDDFNDFGGDGCSAVCLREIKEVAASSDTQVVVTIMPLGQICRIYNARQHETLEDTTYHLQNTIVTGDVSDPNDLRIHVQVLNGSIAMKPLVDIYLAQGRNDSIWQAIVQRETGVHFEPYSDNMKETVISGTHFEVARFLQYFMYIAPDLDFNGYVSVLFTVVSGMVMNHGAEVCESNVVVRVIPVFNDPASVMVLDSIKNSGYQCQAASASCSLAGISLYDPDCESAVDGSCFLRLELNASLGFLSVPGHPAGWQEVFPSLVGHAAGLNAALERLSFFPPALPPEPPEAALHVSVHRVIERTIATPEGLLPMVTSLTLPIHILSADTPPTLSLSSGDAFHGAVFIMSNTKPHYFTDIVFEPPGAIVTTCIIELKVSKGLLFLGDTGGLWFADGTNNGESRLRFVANSTDIRNRFLADVRYAWDDNDCSNLEQFNITVDSGHHEPLTLIALLVLPDCQGYQAQWMGSNKLSMMEDSEISIGHLNLTTKDTHLFLMVDVKHGPAEGDCKLVRWPESIPSFVPGRECHLDGLVKGLNEVLPYLVYRPPPDFFGTVQLEFIVFKTEASEEILGRSTGISSRGVPQSILVEIEVAGVNDGPSLEVFLDSYRLQEDAEEYLVLGPMFVTDIDADQNEMSFKFELIAGHEWNTLMMCGLLGVHIEEPWEYTLDEDGCFLIGTSAIHFNTTVENFNSLQSGPGRLRFRAARDWHGSAVINVSVDDRGSGHGEEFHLSANRSLYIMVEPKVDRPRLSVLCPEQIPFVTYGRNCLEVKDCFALNASLDGTDVGLSFWLVIQADDERVNINLEDRAPVQVWQEGTAELHMAGLYHNIQEALRALVFRPPGQLFEDAYDAHTFEFNVTVTAIALGERFNEPWPITPGPGMRHDARAFPSDQVDFSVVVRRMNRPPLLFIDRPAFSVTQLQADVILYGVTVADPDIRSDDLLELVVSAEEDGPGDLAFAGLRGKRLQRRMRLEELNQALQELTFIFDNANWFGVTGVSLWVSDLGNHGWRVDRKTTPYSSVGLEAEERGELTASSFLAVHRSFVNEPPRIILEEPRSGLLEVFEDHGQFASFMVMHKASEHLVDRMLTVFMSTSHGQLRSISLQNATDRGVRSSLDGKRLEYTAWLYELNTFLAQLEFLPDPNYNGPDELVVMITDGEYEVNTSVPIQIASLTDPLIIVCPPAVDLFEGQRAVPIGANISIRDFEPLPGDGDEDSEVQVEIFVGDGGLQLLPGMPLPPELEPFMNDSEAEELAAWNGTRNGSGDDGPESSRLRVPRIQTLWFNTTLAGFRDVLKALAFTPYPELYHGVVHFEIRVSMLHTMESARCEIGLVVHPVNSAPVIHFDHSRLWAATNGGIVKPHKNIQLHGVVRLSDPDEEDFSGGWFVEQMHSARLKLEVSCGTMSFLIAGPQDYVFGVQNGSIAGLEGITFHKGDGSHDTEMDITSTLANLNLQLSRLFYHSGGECRQQNISLSVELDDLGNFGASKDEMGNFGHPLPIVVWKAVQFQVAEF